MSEEQQLIDRIIANYKAEQIKVSTLDIQEPTPLQLQELWLQDLEERIEAAEKHRLKMLGLYAANLIMLGLVGYLSIVALIMVNQNP